MIINVPSITVKKLIAALNEYDPEDVIILSSDSEGDSFSPCCPEIEDGVYVPATKTIYIKELTDELREQGFCEDDLYKGDNGYNCVTLWPT